MTRRAILLSLFCGLFFALCGRKGPLLPPLARVPQPVQNLTLSQQGGQIILTWTNPSAYVDGSPLASVSQVEIWMAEGGEDFKEGISTEDFRVRAQLLARVKPGQPAPPSRESGTEAGLSFVYIPEKAASGAGVLAFSLRVQDAKKRVSDFSEPRPIEVRALPDPPRGLRATVFPDHIEVRWEASAVKAEEEAAAEPVGYNVYRSEGKATPVAVNSSPLQGLEFRDTDFVFGRTYRYFVRASALGSRTLAESEDSEVVEAEAKDVFPPAAPAGLTAVAGAGVIALSWEAGPEPDIAGYRVWRREEGQAAFTLLRELAAAENSYTDSRVEKNRRYVYAITAVDTAGNESQKSNPAGGVTRDGPA
jgi:predicted small lipoprotein YifL